MSLTPIGTSMDFKAIDIEGKEFTEHIVNKDGIITDLISNVKKPIVAPIIISNDDGTHKLDMAFCYDLGDDASGPDETEYIVSFSNYCQTVAGTHVDGCLEGLVRWFSLYMNNIYLANQKSKDKLKVISADIKTGLNMFIGAAHLYSNFIGQSKDILSNEDMVGFCKDTVMKGLDEWYKANPRTWNYKEYKRLKRQSKQGKE